MNNSATALQRWGVAFGAFLLSACVSVPPPNEQLLNARASVADAINAGAADYAAMEIKRAQAKLNDADAAMGAREYVRARRLSEQAELDAKFAMMKTSHTKAQRDLAELEQNVRALQAESNRSTP